MAYQTVVNNQFLNDLSVLDTTGGAVRKCTIANQVDVAGSSAAQIIQVAGATSDDVYTQYNVNGVTQWSNGIDNSDSDKWKLNSSATPSGGSNTITAFTTGNVIQPRNCCVVVSLSADVPAATGDGTDFTIIFDSVIADQNSNYNVLTGEFTAPVTGMYLFTSQVTWLNINAANDQSLLRFTTPARNFDFSNGAPGKGYDASNGFHISAACIVPLTAGNTSTVETMVSGGAKTVIIAGSTPTVNTQWCICLIS